MPRPSPPPAPIACSLDAHRLADRRGEWEQLCRAAMIGLEHTTTGVELRFRREPAAASTLRRLVELERNCCSFASWTVGEHEHELVLPVSGPPEAVPAVHALFSAGATGSR